jgi:hypothetical protein
MRLIIPYLIAFFIVGPVTTLDARGEPQNPGTTKSQKQPPAPETKSGDKAKNLKVLPPWTMRLCPKDLYATYDITGAKELKKTDSACALWQTKSKLLEAQTTDFKTVVKDLKAVVETHKEERKLDQQRIQDLIKQVNKEIEEKNTYKYKPNYNWLFISIGAALAVAGVCFGVGVWVAKDNK